MAKIFLFPNPYCHVDHAGRLAGACLQADGPRAQTSVPTPKHVGAEMRITPGSYDNDAAAGRGTGGPRGSRADKFFQFDCMAPVVLDVGPELAHFYMSRAASGDVLVAKSESEVPLEALASARLKCMANMALSGLKPDDAMWEKQFPLDVTVKAVAQAMLDAAPKVEAEKIADPAKEAAELRKSQLASAAKAGEELRKNIANRGKSAPQPAGKAEGTAQ